MISSATEPCCAGARTRSNLRFSLSSMVWYRMFCTATGSRMSSNRWTPSSPADSMVRSPARTRRSKRCWWKKTVLIRSSGISIAALGDDALPVDAPVRRHHEVGGVPLDEPVGHVGQAHDDQQDRDPLRGLTDETVPALGEEEDPQRHGQDHPDHRPDQHDPVRVLVDDDLLVAMQVGAVVGHGEKRTAVIHTSQRDRGGGLGRVCVGPPATCGSLSEGAGTVAAWTRRPPICPNPTQNSRPRQIACCVA